LVKPIYLVLVLVLVTKISLPEETIWRVSEPTDAEWEYVCLKALDAEYYKE